MNKKRTWIIIGSICLCVAVLLVLSACVSISGEPLMAGGAVGISFDKWDMLRADKVIVCLHDETYTVTDPAFVEAFAKESLSGTYSEYCCSGLDDGWVEFYRGDRLLRHMRYIANHSALAYEADATHWVLFGREGHAFVSNDLHQKLLEFLDP